MKMYGKTLFFNESDGNGIIITQKRKKINFSVADWDDFDVMPTKGLEIVFDYIDEKASNILAKVNEAHGEEEPIVAVAQEQNYSEEESDKVLEKEEVKSKELLKVIDAEEVEISHEHFDDKSGIVVIDDIEEVLEATRPESITNTLNLSTAITNYFDIIKYNIDSRSNYKKVEGRLDYLLVSRFLWTTYNNLTDIDIKIITPKIKSLHDDLKKMAHIHEDFMRKTKYPKLAYEEVFLSCQAEYQKIKDGAQKIINKLSRLRIDEKYIGSVREVKKKELEESIQSEQFTLLEGELKSLNGVYVDVVHMMAELDERYKADMRLLHDFEKEYREDFYRLFSVEAHKNKHDLVDILNAQAFIFDVQLWHQAKHSKSVKAHFKKSSISGELNTKTYLKYYLSTQDSNKASGDTKKLFELYEYLVSVHHDYILIVAAQPQDAMEYEAAIKSLDHSFNVKYFVDEITAIRWAMKNSIEVLVLEEQLSKVRVEKFLDIYTKNVLSTPKVVLIGAKPRTNILSVSRLVSAGASPRILAQSVQSLMEESD